MEINLNQSVSDVWYTHRFDIDDQCDTVLQQHVLSNTGHRLLHQHQVGSDVYYTLDVVLQKLSLLKGETENDWEAEKLSGLYEEVVFRLLFVLLRSLTCSTIGSMQVNLVSSLYRYSMEHFSSKIFGFLMYAFILSWAKQKSGINIFHTFLLIFLQL